MAQYSVVAPTRSLLKAALLAKVTAGASEINLDHVYVSVSNTGVTLVSTNDSIAVKSTVSLIAEIPDLEVAPITFLILAESLYNLIAEMDSEEATLVIDLNKNSIRALIQSSELVLPVKNTKSWTDIDSRFVLRSTSQEISIELLQSMLDYNKFFLSNGQDTLMHLIEIREGQALATDRIKFGCFTTSYFDALELKISGSLVGTLVKLVDQLPSSGVCTLGESDSYTTITFSSDDLNVTLGFVKCSGSLPQALDKVPEVQEAYQVQLNRGVLSKAVSRLSTVAPKNEPKLKLTLKNSKLHLSVTNDQGQDSKDCLPVIPIVGDEKPVEVSLPLGLFKKFIKLSDTEDMFFRFHPKYLKILEKEPDVEKYSVFQSISGSKA